METYKVAAIAPNKDGYLDIWTRDGRMVPVFVPMSCSHLLRRGMRVRVHRNRAGNVVACSFGDVMVMMTRPTTRESITEFVGEFKDIYEMSLDSIIFKYALRRSLKKMGMIPTRSLVTDIMSYNYINNIGRGR